MLQGLCQLRRVRRALTLQTGSGSLACPDVQPASRRNVCSKSVGDLNLSGARLQSAARANLSRSADWPASSAACIRKRVVSLANDMWIITMCCRIPCMCSRKHGFCESGFTKCHTTPELYTKCMHISHCVTIESLVSDAVDCRTNACHANCSSDCNKRPCFRERAQGMRCQGRPLSMRSKVGTCSLQQPA